MIMICYAIALAILSGAKQDIGPMIPGLGLCMFCDLILGLIFTI